MDLFLRFLLSDRLLRWDRLDQLLLSLPLVRSVRYLLFHPSGRLLLLLLWVQ